MYLEGRAKDAVCNELEVGVRGRGVKDDSFYAQR